MMAFTRVCSIDDVWEGEMEVFEVDETEVLVIHLAPGVVRATQPYCPHQQAELVEGDLSGTVLTCKRHLWQFDLTTCLGINPDDSEIANYPAEIRGEEIYVDVERDVPKSARR